MNDYLLQRASRLFRFRHKRGYGIHSPFVFDLVTNVLRERAEYYAFREIEPVGKREQACSRLLFRLAEREGYQRALLVGTGCGVPARYLSAVSAKMRLLDENESAGNAGSWELFYAGRVTQEMANGEWERWLTSRAQERACAVITGIHEHRFNRLLWNYFREESRVAIDMTGYGILFFDRRLQPGRYAL
jgi:hypothetical protein